MLAKALKHKTLPDTWGTFMEDGDIATCSIPTLHPLSATETDMKNYWANKHIVVDMEAFELVEVTINLNVK